VIPKFAFGAQTVGIEFFLLPPRNDKLVKSLILLAPQAILGFMTRLTKLQELGLTPSNSLQFLTPDAS